MPKLTDTQLVILSAAARRQDRAVLPLPKSLKIKGGATTKTLDGLRKKGPLEDKPTTRNAAAWRHEDDGPRMLPGMTDAGLTATRADAGGANRRHSAQAKVPLRRSSTTY